jgi:DNA-binding FadR family transcriptional regulator
MSSMTQEASIAAELRDDILRGQYRCGERLPSERDLAERFGVHRSTVRAAVKRLEQLGIADVRPGGARVSPIEEASLEVLEHMLALQDPPDTELVDHTLEAMGGFLAHAARIGVERAADDERNQLIAILDEMIESGSSEQRRGELFAALGAALAEATHNPVLILLRNGLRTRYSDYVFPDHRPRSVSRDAVGPLLIQLKKAIVERNGADASDAIHDISTLTRAAIRSSLEIEHDRAARTGEAR